MLTVPALVPVTHTRDTAHDPAWSAPTPCRWPSAWARVTVIDKNVDRLRHLDLIYGNRITTLFSTAHTIEEAAIDADLVIGGVLIPGAAAPKLVTADMVARMKTGAVIVDVAIDQGGCVETSHPTTHAEPTFVVERRRPLLRGEHAVGAVARTSTFALNHATIGHALELAGKGWRQALKESEHLRNGLNVALGSSDLRGRGPRPGYVYTPAAALLN